MSIGKIVYDRVKPLWIQSRVVSIPNHNYPTIPDGVYLAGIKNPEVVGKKADSGVAGCKVE